MKLNVYYDEKRKTYRAQYKKLRDEVTGETYWTYKRGFKTEREAQKFIIEQEELLEKQLKTIAEQQSKKRTIEEAEEQDKECELSLEDFFYGVYTSDISNVIKLNSLQTKLHIFQTKIAPYLGNMRVCDIKPKHITRWQNTIQGLENSDGDRLSETYLRTINNQFSSILNHAVKNYDLPSNPFHKVGNMGSKDTEEMKVWTPEEFNLFINEIMENEEAYYIFRILYVGGLRLGELLALTPKDIDFNSNVINIKHSYQRINKKDVITSPKTKSGIRKVEMPKELMDELRSYIEWSYHLNSDDRIFHYGKSTLHRIFSQGTEAAGLNEIRIHDLRHSHVSYLISKGLSVPAIAKRIGHTNKSVTMAYAHMLETEQEKVSDVINNMF